MTEQIEESLDFLEYIYGLFGFEYELQLSTRPENRLGSDELWDQAEAALEKALNNFGKPWTYNHGDGAFYGPKIDIQVLCSLKKRHQCGTMQVDYQQPIRFNLQYQSETAAQEQEAIRKLGKDVEKPKLASQVFPPDEND